LDNAKREELLEKHKAEQKKVSTKEVIELIFLHIFKGILYGIMVVYLFAEFLFTGRFKEFMDDITIWQLISSDLYIILILVAVLECIHNFLNAYRMKAVKLKKPKWLKKIKK
jgi:hypothetical protein